MADAPAKTPDKYRLPDKAKTDDKAKPGEKALVAKAGGPTMRVRIASPFRVYFDDQAFTLSGVNATGPFDILPHHHNFISLLTAGELAVRTNTGTTRVQISGGLMHVKQDNVVVFLNV